MASAAAAASAGAAIRRRLPSGGAWAAAAALPTAVVLVAAGVTGRHTPVELAAISGCAAVLAVLAGIDVYRRVIPNRIIYPTLGVVFAATLVRADQPFVGALAGAAFASTPFLVAFFVIPQRISAARARTSPGRIGDAGGVKWAGGVGALAVLLTGLLQADQSAVGAIAAATVAGCPFLPLFVRPRWDGIADRRAIVTQKGARGMGGGDVKLAALLGAIAGAPGVFAALSVAVFGGACAALTAAVMRRWDLDTVRAVPGRGHRDRAAVSAPSGEPSATDTARLLPRPTREDLRGACSTLVRFVGAKSSRAAQPLASCLHDACSLRVAGLLAVRTSPSSS